jgi:hypothetical protein
VKSTLVVCGRYLLTFYILFTKKSHTRIFCTPPPIPSKMWTFFFLQKYFISWNIRENVVFFFVSIFSHPEMCEKMSFFREKKTSTFLRVGEGKKKQFSHLCILNHIFCLKTTLAKMVKKNMQIMYTQLHDTTGSTNYQYISNEIQLI